MAPNKQLQMLVGMLSVFYSYATNKNYYGTPYCTTFLSICITIYTKACNNNIILNVFSLVGDLQCLKQLSVLKEFIWNTIHEIRILFGVKKKNKKKRDE